MVGGERQGLKGKERSPETESGPLPLDGGSRGHGPARGAGRQGPFVPWPVPVPVAGLLPGRVDKEDVMTCLIKGCNFVLKNIPHEAFVYQKGSNPEFRFQTNHPSVFPYLLVSIGSGVSIVKVGPGSWETTGLCSALLSTGCKSEPCRAQARGHREADTDPGLPLALTARGHTRSAWRGRSAGRWAPCFQHEHLPSPPGLGLQGRRHAGRGIPLSRRVPGTCWAVAGGPLANAPALISLQVETEDRFEWIGGSSIGGGTFWGLGALLTKTKVFGQLWEDAPGSTEQPVSWSPQERVGGCGVGGLCLAGVVVKVALPCTSSCVPSL